MDAWQRSVVARILHGVINVPAADRSAFLDRASGGDAAVRAKVSELLDVLAPDGFLAPTAGVHTDVMAPGEQPPTEAYSQESDGSRIGRYKLLDRIGEGGFGVVYLAEQEHPVRRQVALKVIKLGMDTRHLIARFEAERQALAMMDHPNIAKVLDAGSTDAGRPYFVMEFVEGKPVTDYCDENKLDTRSRLQLFTQICRAIQHAHQKAVIHRDIKPSNVLVTVQGDGAPVPKVIDFGIAKAMQAKLTEKTLFTGFGHFIGTPQYMSPEQADAGPAGVDTRSDIYSLGVLLYELLTGATPFAKEELRSKGQTEVRRIIREKDPPKPSTRISTLADDAASAIATRRRTDARKLARVVRGDLDWVVMKCLEKDRTRRYDSADALSADVERYLRGQTVLAGAPSAAHRLRKYVRRHRIGLLAGGTVTASLVMLLAAVVYGSMRDSKQRQKHLTNLQTEQVKTLAAERQARDAANVQRYLSGVTNALTSLSGGKTGRTWEAFAELAQVPRLDGAVRDPLELRCIAAQCLTTLDLRKVRTVRQNLNARCLAFSPDGKYLAIGKHKGFPFWVDVVDVATGHIIINHPILAWARTKETGVSSLAFSPDGNWLAAGTRDGSMYAWSTQSPQAAPLKWSPHSATVGDVAFFPGRAVILSCSEDGTLKASDLAAGGRELCSVGPGGHCSDLACSPNSGMIVVAGETGLHAFALDFSAEAPRFQPQWSAAGNYRKARFSPDGRTLAVTRDNNILLIDPAERGAELATLRDPTIDASHRDEVFHLEFSPDGSLLVSGSGDRTLKLWELATGRVAASSVVAGTGIVYPAFSPDGRRVASTDENCVALYEVGGVDVQSLLARHAHPIVAMDVATASGSTELACLTQKRQAAGPRQARLTVWEAAPDGGRLIREHPLTSTLYDEAPLLLHAIAHDPRLDLTVYALDGEAGVFRAAGSQPWEARVDEHIALAVSPRGDGVWSVTGDSLMAWNAADLRVTHRWTNGMSGLLHGNSGLLCLSVGLERVAVGARDGKVRLFEPTLSRPPVEWEFGVPVNAIALSPDASLLVAGGQDGRVQMFQVPSGKPVARVNAHRDSVDSVCFAPTPTPLFATGSRDGNIYLWRCGPAGIEKVLTLGAPGALPVRTIRFSADGKDLFVLLQNEKAIRTFHLEHLNSQLQRIGLQW